MDTSQLQTTVDKKGFSSSGTEGMIYVYKITMENMVRRRDSSVSVQSLTISEGTISRSSTSEIIFEDIPSDATSLDFVHPVLEDPENPSKMLRGFGGDVLQKRLGSRRKMNMVETISELDTSESSTAEHPSVLDTVSLESAECSSPDSGIDFTPPMTRPQREPRLHHHSHSSPSLLGNHLNQQTLS